MQDWKPTEEGAIARKLLRQQDFGVLSSMSLELPGYPFGSVTPYVLTRCGRPVVYVSHIAQHTANMAADARTCLTVVETSVGNQQAVGRVTLLGDASEVPAEQQAEVAERYFAFFPEAREYGSAHAFQFVWLETKRVRYIGGFGKIFWIEQEAWSVPRPEWAAQEGSIIEHMNSDHRESLGTIAKSISGTQPSEVLMLASDVEGFHLRADDLVLYAAYPAPAWSLDEVRAAMIQLARGSG